MGGNSVDISGPGEAVIPGSGATVVTDPGEAVVTDPGAVEVTPFLCGKELVSFAWIS